VAVMLRKEKRTRGEATSTTTKPFPAPLLLPGPPWRNNNNKSHNK